jgi:molecular chaperone HscC
MSTIPKGIDLGTSNAAIGVFKNGKVNIVPNSIGDPLTSSIVDNWGRNNAS